MIELVLRIFLSFVIWCAVGSAINFNQPIKNADYQGLIGPGFATNYFKTLAFQKYHKQNLIDVYARGFRNLRLRCRADLEGLNMTGNYLLILLSLHFFLCFFTFFVHLIALPISAFQFIFVPNPLCWNVFFLFRQFWPIDIIIVKSCE